MIVFVIDAFHIFAGELECHAPVAAHPHRPCSLPSTAKFMEAQPRQVHVSRFGSSIEAPQDQAQAFGMLGLDRRLAASGKKSFEALVLKSLDCHRIQCNGAGYRLQPASLDNGHLVGRMEEITAAR